MVQALNECITDEEKSVLVEEIKDFNSMVYMIFRFFLQSGEYKFFIRRLKNVAITKISLKQLKANEFLIA